MAHAGDLTVLFHAAGHSSPAATSKEKEIYMGKLSHTLADRLEAGAKALADFVASLSDAEWNTRLPKDGRTVGVVVHHVASVYPIEIQLAQTLASGQPVKGVTWAGIHEMNAKHAEENTGADRETTLDLLGLNGMAAAAVIRDLSDEQLQSGGSNSLYADAPLTCQFMLEDHAVRHSYHHLARIREALGR